MRHAIYCNITSDHEHNLLIHLNVQNLLNNGHKSYILALSQVYFTCIKPLLWMIGVPNMNKINLFFSETSQQTYKMYEKVTILNYSNLAQS